MSAGEDAKTAFLAAMRYRRLKYKVKSMTARMREQRLRTDDQQAKNLSPGVAAELVQEHDVMEQPTPVRTDDKSPTRAPIINPGEPIVVDPQNAETLRRALPIVAIMDTRELYQRTNVRV
jgi:hypothetical protein